ncbi:MAG: hypothetical protein ACYDEX_06825 [Mobilitalea sp.]
MPKQTRLDENAEIYQTRRELTEKEKLKDMSTRNKLSYLWEYYKIHALITIVVISVLSYIIHSVLTPNVETQLYAAMVNNTISPEILEEYQANFAKQLQLDPETESVELNTSFMVSSNNEYSMSMKEVLGTYVAAQQVDIMIAPQSVFEGYAYYGFMEKLSDQLPTDVYSSLTDNFYITDLEDDTEKNVYGIFLTDTKLYKNNADNSDPYVLGIIANSKHKANAVEFIRYLFNEK